METPRTSRPSLLSAFDPVPSPPTRFPSFHRRTQSPSPSSSSSLRSASPSSSPRPGRSSRLFSSTSSPSTSPHASRRRLFSSIVGATMSTRFVIRRRPSTVDLQLEEEKHSTYVEHVGLSMMEPRPVNVLPVSVGGSEIWDGTQSSRSSWVSQMEDIKRRSAVIGEDSSDDGLDGTIEGRLSGNTSRGVPLPLAYNGVEAGSFVMDSIFEVIESGR